MGPVDPRSMSGGRRAVLAEAMGGTTGKERRADVRRKNLGRGPGKEASMIWVVMFHQDGLCLACWRWAWDQRRIRERP